MSTDKAIPLSRSDPRLLTDVPRGKRDSHRLSLIFYDMSRRMTSMSLPLWILGALRENIALLHRRYASWLYAMRMIILQELAIGTFFDISLHGEDTAVLRNGLSTYRFTFRQRISDMLSCFQFLMPHMPDDARILNQSYPDLVRIEQLVRWIGIRLVSYVRKLFTVSCC